MLFICFFTYFLQLYRQVMEEDVWVPRVSSSHQTLCIREDGKQLDAKLVLAVTVW